MVYHVLLVLISIAQTFAALQIPVTLKPRKPTGKWQLMVLHASIELVIGEEHRQCFLLLFKHLDEAFHIGITNLDRELFVTLTSTLSHLYIRM